MRHIFQYNAKDIHQTKRKILAWADSFNHLIYFDSNNYNKINHFSFYTYDCLIAVGAKHIISSNNNSFNKLKTFYDQHKDWCFGYFSYDLKNEIEPLESSNTDNINADNLLFFIPEYVFIINNNSIKIECFQENFDPTFKKINEKNLISEDIIQDIKLNCDFSPKEYLDTVGKIKSHIKYGDVYELNLCINFHAKESKISPVDLFNRLMKISPVPFANYMKINDLYVMSASPERFIKKYGQKIISQPIKGTIKRGKNPEEDKFLKEQLRQNSKEKSENVMIVDLVRNDLSKTARPGSVKVEELFGIYSFKQVHQMISTVVSEIDEQFHPVDVIKNAFPMGSMTGAPKLKAMQLIEHYEKTKRGIYSGSVGYFDPDSNFDFSVIIRTMIYNRLQKYLSFHVGGAITDGSVAENEYEECLLKAKAMMDTINSD